MCNCQDIIRHKIQEALFNVGLHENLITLAHLSYFLTFSAVASAINQLDLEGYNIGDINNVRSTEQTTSVRLAKSNATSTCTPYTAGERQGSGEGGDRLYADLKKSHC